MPPLPEGLATGVVLAGGRATRFDGGQKALARVCGRPIIERVVDALAMATGRDPIVAVADAGQRRTYAAVLDGRAAVVRDAPDREGPVAGLLAGAAAARTPWLVVCGCDMPFVSPAAVGWLLEQRAGADAVAVVGTDGRPSPLHAGYRRAAVLAAREGLDRAPSLRSLLGSLDAVAWVDPADAPDPAVMAASISNVNTRADLAAARARCEPDG